jgi:hypothetical protein
VLVIGAPVALDWPFHTAFPSSTRRCCASGQLLGDAGLERHYHPSGTDSPANPNRPINATGRVAHRLPDLERRRWTPGPHSVDAERLPEGRSSPIMFDQNVPKSRDRNDPQRRDVVTRMAFDRGHPDDGLDR